MKTICNKCPCFNYDSEYDIWGCQAPPPNHEVEIEEIEHRAGNEWQSAYITDECKLEKITFKDGTVFVPQEYEIVFK